MNTQSKKQVRATDLIALAASILAGLLVVAAGLVGCAKSGDQTAVAPLAPVPGAVTSGCAAGQIYSAQYSCLNQYGCSNRGPDWGWVPGQNICVQGEVVTTVKTGANYYAPLSIIGDKVGVFQQALQTAGLCDQSSIGGIGKDWGYSACRNYSRSGYIIIQGNVGNPSQAYLQIVAGSSNPNRPNTDWTTGGRTLPMAGMVNVYPYNGSAGFVATNGGAGGIQVTADTGVPGTATNIAIRISFNGQEFARANLTRY